MAKTAIADVIVPEVFLPYMIERTAARSVFVKSGIVNPNDSELNAIAAGGGTTAHMPFWQDLTGGRQLLSDSAPLTVNKIGASQDICCIHNDGNAWSTNLLAGLLAGSDPMKAIADLVADYWGRQDSAMLIASVKGVMAAFKAEGTPPNVLTIFIEDGDNAVDANELTGETFILACQTMGDQNARLVAVAMHSAVEASLRIRGLIDDMPEQDGPATIPFFQGRRVIVDDNMPVRAGTTSGYVYTTVLFGPGAFGKGTSNLAGEPVIGGFGTQALEYTRTALASDSSLINRRRFVLHPRGVKWTSAVQASTVGATDIECANASNWTRVFESKNVRMVFVEHNA